MFSQRFPPDLIALKLAISLSIGLLVGLEREWANKDVGIRTFSLISLLGMVAALAGAPVAGVAFAAVIVLVAIVNTRSILVDRSLEITTSAALLVTYVLGLLAGGGHLFTPVASAILMTMLLAWKTELQRFAGGLKPEEVRSAVLLCLIGFVIYPTLPDRFIDPWQLINPREAWVTVIVVAGLGFFNYVLLRLYSARGLYWSALLGGLVNSTAAIIELSELLASSGMTAMIIVVNLLTVIAMFVRNFALLAIFARSAAVIAFLPLAAMAAIAIAFVWRSRLASGDQPAAIKLASPLSLLRVLKFGVFFLVIQVVGAVAERTFGNAGFLVVSAMGGFISSASATVAAANLAMRGRVSFSSAAAGTLLASAASALVNIPLVARQTKDSGVALRLAGLTLLQILGGILALMLEHLVLSR